MTGFAIFVMIVSALVVMSPGLPTWITMSAFTINVFSCIKVLFDLLGGELQR